jgi:hypothetical protein
MCWCRFQPVLQWEISNYNIVLQTYIPSSKLLLTFTSNWSRGTIIASDTRIGATCRRIKSEKELTSFEAWNWVKRRMTWSGRDVLLDVNRSGSTEIFYKNFSICKPLKCKNVSFISIYILSIFTTSCKKRNTYALYA